MRYTKQLNLLLRLGLLLRLSLHQASFLFFSWVFFLMLCRISCWFFTIIKKFEKFFAHDMCCVYFLQFAKYETGKTIRADMCLFLTAFYAYSPIVVQMICNVMQVTINVRGEFFFEGGVKGEPGFYFLSEAKRTERVSYHSVTRFTYILCFIIKVFIECHRVKNSSQNEMYGLNEVNNRFKLEIICTADYVLNTEYLCTIIYFHRLLR